MAAERRAGPRYHGFATAQCAWGSVRVPHGKPWRARQRNPPKRASHPTADGRTLEAGVDLTEREITPTAIECCGEWLTLHPEGAVHWPRRATVFIADPHFGKDEHFRRAGLALPPGTLADDLARLDRVLGRTGAQRLVVLGDLVHAAPGAGATWPDRISAWREHHPGLEWLAVAGNHDRGLDPPAAWGLDWRSERLSEGPFAFAHEPAAVAGHYTLAGHWHPVAILSSKGERARLPVFAFGDDGAVLPAFGGFTGGGPVVDPAMRTYALVDDRVIPLPDREPAR